MNDKLASLRLDLSLRLLKIEDYLRSRGVAMENITLIARDPNNDKMFVVLTNEDSAGLGKVCAMAIEAQKPTGEQNA